MIVREGIILKSIDYKDYSKLIYIIGPEGLETLIVKGAKKPHSKNFSYSQPLTKILYDKVETKTFDILTTGLIINNYTTIKENFDKTKYAYQIIELTYQFANHIDDKKLLYSFLDEILEKIDVSQFANIYELIFRLKLLYLLGVGPVFSRCIDCQAKDNLIGFVLESGGMKCHNCLEQTDNIYNDETIKYVKSLYLMKLDQMTEEFLNQFPDIYDQVNHFINNYYQYFLGYQSKVSKVFKSL